MRSRAAYLALSLAVASAPLALPAAPTAEADCVDAGSATVCAQGTVTGGGPEAPTAGPYYPYPCQYDWYCDNDGGLSIILDPGPPGGGIDIGRPGRPGRPGGGGGGIGPR